MSEHFNQLTPAQDERLALLLEELGEAQQAIGKILRHGYESRNPLKKASPENPTNRYLLERELGDVQFAVSLLCKSSDLGAVRIKLHEERKQGKTEKFLHHQI